MSSLSSGHNVPKTPGSIPIPIPMSTGYSIPTSVSPTILIWQGRDYVLSSSRTPSLVEDHGESSAEDDDVEDTLWDLELDSSAAQKHSPNEDDVRVAKQSRSRLHAGAAEAEVPRGRQGRSTKTKVSASIITTSNLGRISQAYPSPESSPERSTLAPVAVPRAPARLGQKVHRGRSFRRLRS